MCHSPRAQESSTNGEPKHGLCTSILIPSRPHWAQPATMPICSEKLLTYTALMPLSGSHLTDGTASNDHSFLSASPRHASNAAIDQILAPYVLSCIAPFEDKIEALSPVSAPDANIEFPEKKTSSKFHQGSNKTSLPGLRTVEAGKACGDIGICLPECNACV